MSRNHPQSSLCTSTLLNVCMSNFHTNILYFIILQETNLDIELRHRFNDFLMTLPDGDKLKQRVVNILAEWDQVLLNDLSGGRWVRTSPDWHDLSLVYVSKSRFHGERYVSVVSPNTSFLNTELRMSPDTGLSIEYGLKLSCKNWLESMKGY